MIHEVVRLKYAPASEPLHISVKKLFLGPVRGAPLRPRDFCRTFSVVLGRFQVADVPTLKVFTVAPLGGLRGFRWGWFVGCYVTKFAPHNALKLIV